MWFFLLLLMLPLLLMIAIFGKGIWLVSRTDVRKSIAQSYNTLKNGLTFEEVTETEHYTRRHTVENGIERITYRPHQKRYETPILFLHGMWHGAWCWAWWQALFAEWGWESTAFSLPGHARSPEQRSVEDCTLDYYTSFLREEVERLDHLPILVGHSMGGAITQWYLKYVRDDLPAVVLVGAWPAHDSASDGFKQFMKVDPVGVLLGFISQDANPYIRTPEHAARKLISEGAVLSPEALHERLGPESIIVTLQHNPPFWSPKDVVAAPMLYVAGEIDAVLSVDAARKTAEHYKADFIVVEKTAHNIQMEHSYQATAKQIEDWLLNKARISNPSH